MDLLFDARLLHRTTSGLERVQINLLRSLAASSAITRLRALVQEGSDLEGILPERVETCEVTDSDDILAILLAEDEAERPELYHLTYFPDRHPRDLLLLAAAPASVVSVTDAILNRHPEYHRSVEEHHWYDRFVRELARSCDRIVSYSESAAREAVADLHADRSRIDVTPLAIEPALTEPLAQADVARRLEEIGVEPGYFVMIGKDYPHKDHLTALRALASQPAEVRLICAGSRLWYEPLAEGRTLDQWIERLSLGERVRWISGLDDDGVKALMQGSLGLLYPSLEEGFGLPPLEAMALGVPVIAAEAMSIPEVCGSGAWLIPPGDHAALAQRMGQLVRGGTEVEELIQQGRQRSAEFTWERCRDGLLDCYRSAIEAGAARRARRGDEELRFLELLRFVAHYPFGDAGDVRAWQERHDELLDLFRELEQKHRELAAAMPRWSLGRRLAKIRRRFLGRS